MVDMSQFVQPKSDQLNADDMIAGPRTITIRGVKGTGSAEQPVAIYFEGDNNKPYKPCKSMARVMIAAWGPDAATYAGRSMTLYRDADVVFGGMKVGGIRISHMSHIDGTLVLALTVTKAKRAPYKVLPLKSQAPQRPAAVEEATGPAPEVETGEAAAPVSGGFDLGEPEHVLAARGIEAALKAAEYPSDLEAIRRMKSEWAMVKRGDPSLFETLGRIAKTVEARLVGEGAEA